ncbi:MAG: ROK family protein [Candidatus Methylomirabilales bacterium]
MDPESLILGVDLGGTRLAVGLVEPTGRVLSCRSVATGRLGRGERLLDNVLEVLGWLREDAERLGRPLAGVGLGVPGVVDEATGAIGADVQNLPELRDVKIVQVIHERTGLPVVADNDVNALLLGEWIFGQARGRRHVAMIAAGTGVGGALILNGQLVRGARGYAGEIGHVTVDPEGPECLCGSRGCIKAYASGPDIAQQARALCRRNATPILSELCGGDFERLDCPAVLAAARRGDPIGLTVAHRAARALGVGVATLINLCNPELILLAGGVLEAGEVLLGPIRRWARLYAFEAAYESTTIRRSSFTKESGVQGGAALFLHRRAG